MKLATIILSLFAFAGCAVADEMPAAQVMGHGRTVDVDDADAVASMNQFVVGARSLEITNGRRLTSALDKLEVMIKNVDCSACIEAPVPVEIRKLRGINDRELAPRPDVFVSALNCDSSDPFQIWNLLALEPTGTWYLMESVETGECMQLVGECQPSGDLYDIVTGDCDPTNTKAFWGLSGIGEIVNFECFRSNWETNTFLHSTPDIFLEAECSFNKGVGTIDYLDLSSHSADSEDQAQNYWVIYPKTFGDLVTPP